MFRYLTLLILLLAPLLANASNLRIVASSVYDQGETSFDGLGTFSIDTRQANCELDPNEDEDLEPFFDTALKISVTSNLNQDVRFNKLRFRMRFRDDNGNRARVRVKNLGVSRGAIVPGFGETSDVIVLLFDHKIADRQKGFPRTSTVLPEDAGFRRIRYSLAGRTSDGRRVQLRSSFTVSLDNFDRCT